VIPSVPGNTSGKGRVRAGIAPGAGSAVAFGMEFSVASVVVICFAAGYASVSV